MKQIHRLTCVIEREDDSYVSSCPELDIASQGATIEEARRNLVEAVELYLASADPGEAAQHVGSEVYVTSIEVTVG